MSKLEISNLILALLIVMIWFSFFMVSSYMEARTFNKLTGSNVTMWDALFAELRVIK